MGYKTTIYSISSPSFSVAYPLSGQTSIDPLLTKCSIPMHLPSAYYLQSVSPPHGVNIASSSRLREPKHPSTTREPPHGYRRSKTHSIPTRPSSEYSHPSQPHARVPRHAPAQLCSQCPIQTLLRRDEIISKTLGRDSIAADIDVTLDLASDPPPTGKGKRQHIPPPLNLAAPPPRSAHRPRSTSLHIPSSPPDKPLTPLTPLSPIVGYRTVLSEKEQRRRRMVKLARTLGEEIYPELANLPIRDSIKGDWVVLPEQPSITNESPPGFHWRMKKSSSTAKAGGYTKDRRHNKSEEYNFPSRQLEAVSNVKVGCCTKDKRRNKSEEYDFTTRQLASSESLPDLVNDPRRDTKWLPGRKAMESQREQRVMEWQRQLKPAESQRERTPKNTLPKLLLKKNNTACRRSVDMGDPPLSAIPSPIIFCSPPSPVCDYPSFPSHPFRVVDEEDESETSSSEGEEEEEKKKWGEKAGELVGGEEASALEEEKKGELVVVDGSLLSPPTIEVNGGVIRKERRQGWSGEWNQPHILDVIEKLRTLK